MITINIARDFTRTPGARYRSDGEFSGEQFREDFLEKYFQDPKDERIVEIQLDGVEGYSTSFLEEAFGGLGRLHGKDRCLKKLTFLSKDDVVLIDEIESYIKNCDEK